MFAGQSKFKGLTRFRELNQDRVYTVLVTVAHYNCPADNTHTGFTCVMLSDTISVIRNQWGDRIQNLKVFGLLREC